MPLTGKMPKAIISSEHSESFQDDTSGGKILPESCCAFFSPRESLTVPMKECWYCHHADFNLTRIKALDVGICRWPAITIK
jgi:hypothetical protein